MNLNHRTAALITATLAAATTAASVAVNASGQTAAAPVSSTIHLTQVDRSFKFIDVAPAGVGRKPPTQGDAFVIGGQLLMATKIIGKANLVCTTTQPGRRGGSLCDGVLVLQAGQIAFTGYNTVADTPQTVFAVTGGSGTYAGAHGTLTAKTARNDRTTITVQI